MSTPASTWRDEVRLLLHSARKDSDAVRVSALRTAMSAIDNAETPDGTVPSAGAIADSAVGPGSTEVARRPLSDRAADLRAEADVITGILDAR